MFHRKKKQNVDDVTLDYSFDISKQQLNDLMRLRGKEATVVLNERYGGISSLAKKLHCNTAKGLSTDTSVIESHRKVFGTNVIPKDPPKNFFVLCWEAMQDPLLIVLLICAVISIALSFYQQKDSEDKLEWIEGVAIFIAVLVVVVVSAANDWQKDRQFRSLQNRIDEDKLVTVLRSGSLCEINKAELVVGDVYVFKYGDLLQADGFLIQGNDVKIDESSLTGESDLIKKNESNIMLLSGTNVMEGSGHMLVTAVGTNSQMGQIFLLLGSVGTKQESECSSKTKPESDETETTIRSEDNDSIKHQKRRSEKSEKKKKKKIKSKSVLQTKLQRLAVLIGYIGLAAAFLTLFALILRFCITTYVINKEKWHTSHINQFVNFIVQAITVIVVAVPEGLPLAVTLALAFAVKRMLKDNNLVRHLNACETMGNATTICSDKTGTLTTNRMTVTQCYIAGKHYTSVASHRLCEDELLDLIAEAISVNTGYSSMLVPGDNPSEMKKQLGNKTECGLLQFVNDLGRNYEEIRELHPESEFFKVFTFNSARKMMSTIINAQPGYILYTKGASEMVLKRCTTIYMDSGKIQNMTPEFLSIITNGVIEKMASCALRTICIAYRKISKEEGDNYTKLNVWDDDNTVVKNLTCLCIVGMQDPVRPEVPESIKLCQNAGVVVRMVTGDNVNTARSIACDCGIITPSSDFLVLESEEFNRRIRDSNGDISQERLDEVWPNLRVLARSSPQDKYNLVKGIVDSKATQHREVVAVTGDGTNDAPALKIADVGFAMGIQGTDVAKDASDIILTDDNFASIVKAVMWGRNVYDSIAKFLQFQLTANLSAGVFSVVSAAAISTVPLTAVQMLWVNLVMDTLASLALASENPTRDLLNRKPYGRTKFIISPLMFRNIVGQSCYQLLIMFLLIFKGDVIFDTDSAVALIKESPIAAKYPTRHFTAIFNTFVLMTLFNEINSRKLHGEANVFNGIFKNYIFLGIWLGCMFVQVLIVTFGGIAFSTARLTASDWGYCILFGIGSLIFAQVLNLIPANSFSKAAKRIDDLTRRRRRKIEEMPIMDGEAEPDYDEDEDEIEEMEMLWFRGVKRIQTQTKVVDIFRSSIL